jgi:hypothetical protein
MSVYTHITNTPLEKQEYDIILGGHYLLVTAPSILAATIITSVPTD